MMKTSRTSSQECGDIVRRRTKIGFQVVVITPLFVILFIALLPFYWIGWFVERIRKP